jgi:hypothetical protein
MDQDLKTRTALKELEKSYGSNKDPQEPPPPKPGDKWVVFSAVAGMISGVILALVFGRYSSLFIVILVLSPIVGSLAGIFIHSIIKRIIRKS